MKTTLTLLAILVLILLVSNHKNNLLPRFFTGDELTVKLYKRCPNINGSYEQCTNNGNYKHSMFDINLNHKLFRNNSRVNIWNITE